jgi:hypothetical protein
MKSIKQKIFLNLFVTTSVLLPFFIGFNFLGIGWAISSVNFMFLGLISLLISIGSLANRTIFKLEEISKTTYQEIYNEKLKEQKIRLSTLNKKLQKTRNEKDENLLKQLRTVYEGFSEDVRENKMSQFLSTSTANEVDLIFENCIQKLEHSYEIYQTSKDLIGKSKQESEEQRNLILSQVEKDIEHFVDMISRIRALRLKTSLDDSEEIKRRLSIQLRAAERTQVEMERVKNPDDLTRFKEFRDS